MACLPLDGRVRGPGRTGYQLCSRTFDDAFVRRLAFTVHFPLPGEAERLRIWQGIWPQPEILSNDVDLALLYRQFRLSGGNIKASRWPRPFLRRVKAAG